MLDILGNIDTVNFFIQDAVLNTLKKPIAVRGNFYSNDNYIIDITEQRKNVFYYTISNLSRNQICRILYKKEQLVIRYTPQFLFYYNPKTQLFSTNLFDQPFSTSEIESTFFTQSTIFKFEDIKFDSTIMAQTLELIKGLYYEFIQFIETRNETNNTR